MSNRTLDAPGRGVSVPRAAVDQLSLCQDIQPRTGSWAAGRVSSPEGLEPAPCSSPGGSVPNELCLHWTAETSVLLPAGPVNPRHCSCSRAQWNHTGIWGHQECAVLTLKTQREDLLKTQRACIRTKRKTKEVWGEWKK